MLKSFENETFLVIICWTTDDIGHRLAFLENLTANLFASYNEQIFFSWIVFGQFGIIWILGENKKKEIMEGIWIKLMSI